MSQLDQTVQSIQSTESIKERIKKSQKKYRESEKGREKIREAQRRYRNSAKGKEAQRRYYLKRKAKLLALKKQQEDERIQKLKKMSDESKLRNELNVI